MFRDKFRPRALEAGHKLMKCFKRLGVFAKEGRKLQRRRASPDSRPITPDVMTALRIAMTIRCESPLDYRSDKTYNVAPSFTDTDEVCNGLKEHLDHCTKEIMTRQDVEALEPLDEVNGRMKTSRYHIFISIHRRGRLWAELRFASFEKHPIGVGRLQDLTIEVDRMIARYMTHHDPDFVWELPSFLGGLDPLRHRTVSPVINGPQSLCCIPSRLHEPGYSVEVSVRTHDNGLSRNWAQTNLSHQSTPLPLAVAEALMSDVSEVARHAVSELDSSFKAMHRTCNGQEGSLGCKHFGLGAFELLVRIKNELGPSYPHLSVRLTSYRVLVPHSDEDRFLSFVGDLERQIDHARVQADMVLGNADDLKVRVHEIRGEGWTIENPLTLSFDSSTYMDRYTIMKLVERLAVGIRHELNRRGVSALITAHKRGHLILDTHINGGKASSTGLFGFPGSSELDKTDILNLVLDRVRGDLNMVLRNTVTPGNDDALSTLSVITAPTALERAVSAAQSSHSPDNTPPPVPARSPRRLNKKPRQGNLRLFLDYSPSPTSLERLLKGEDGSDKISREATPSLADTDSIGGTDGAVTPEGSPGRRQLWMAGDNSVADITAAGYQSYYGEESEAVAATFYHGGSVSLVRTQDTIRHGKGKMVARDESDDEENMLELAPLRPKKVRQQPNRLLRADEPSTLPNASRPSPQRPGGSTIASLYSLPNTNISAPSPSCQDSKKANRAACNAETNASYGGSEFSETSKQSQPPNSRRPLLLQRIVTPQLASNSSSMVNVVGHIVRRRSETEEPSPNRDGWSLYSFERGPDVI